MASIVNIFSVVCDLIDFGQCGLRQEFDINGTPQKVSQGDGVVIQTTSWDDEEECSAGLFPMSRLQETCARKGASRWQGYTV